MDKELHASSVSSKPVASHETPHLDKTVTILLVGVGGQGTILAGNIVASAAAAAGLDVKVSEIHGMSQRGGSVSTIIRVGTSVSSMVCDPGCADIIVAFEAVEALRARHFLAPGGSIYVNDEVIVPVSVSIGNATMPSDIDKQLSDLGAFRVAAGRIACDVGSPRSANVVLVGALSRSLHLSEDLWKQAVASCVPPTTVDVNLAAFERGCAAVD